MNSFDFCNGYSKVTTILIYIWANKMRTGIKKYTYTPNQKYLLEPVSKQYKSSRFQTERTRTCCVFGHTCILFPASAVHQRNRLLQDYKLLFILGTPGVSVKYLPLFGERC